MFHADSPTRTATSVNVRPRTISQTSPRSAMRGSTPRKAAPTMTIEIPALTNRHVRWARSSRTGARVPVGADVRASRPPSATAQG